MVMTDVRIGLFGEGLARAGELGAGFVVALSGSVMTMPGLGKKPAAVNMHIDGEGNITGLF